MIDATEGCELLDRGYVQIGGCSCTYPMCVKCQIASDFIDEIQRLRAQFQRVEAVIESPYWGTYWGEVMVPQPRLRAALRGGAE